MTYYIAIRLKSGYEIIDETEDEGEARAMQHEYNTVYKNYASVYVKKNVSPGLLKEWNDK